MSENSFANRNDSIKFFKFITLLVPAILVIYSAFIQWGIIKGANYIDNTSILSFSLWWLFVSGLQFLVPSQTKFESKLRIIIYHLLIGSYLIFIAGFNSPFVICWVVMMIIAGEELSSTGVKISVGILALFIVLDLTLNRGFNSPVVITDIMVGVTIVVSSLVMLRISDLHGNTKRALATSRARELLQRNRALTIINNLADAVITTDNRGIIQIYNAASINLLDTNTDLNGHFIDEILPLNDATEKQVSLFDELKNCKTLTKRDDLIYKFSKDDFMRLEIKYSSIRPIYGQDKNSAGYVLILRDITKAKSLEEEKDEFVSVVSHELRTPITIAEGTISNAQIMLEHPDTTKTMISDAIKLAHDQIVFLAGMINDLSTLSRAERGVADSGEYIDVRELAKKLHDKYSGEAREKGLSLDLDLSAKLEGVFVSRLYIEEMLQNLITNSLKYTKKGGIKMIFKQKNNQITFAVKDTGIGISKSDQPKLFQKFYRSEDYRTRETSGTGLGLYITAKLARKINTRVEVKSRLNFGSTFSFVLPVAKKPK